jgi:hypothetical protein
MNRFMLRISSAVVAGLAAAAMATSAAALGANGNIVIVVDENGHGTINGFAGLEGLASYMAADPGPGGLANTLTYDLLNPPGLVSGDVGLLDPEGFVLDYLRFNATEVNPSGNVGSLVFYSDNVDGFDALADTPSPPGALYPNNIVIPEVGTETQNGAIYIPTAGQPGFVAGASAPVEYVFLSDVPEPATWTMMILGMGAIGTLTRRRRVFATTA